MKHYDYAQKRFLHFDNRYLDPIVLLWGLMNMKRGTSLDYRMRRGWQDLYFKIITCVTFKRPLEVASLELPYLDASIFWGGS